MAIFLDGTVKKMAGRPPTFWSAHGIPDVGESKFKSSKKDTVTFGIAGNTPLPPRIIIPTNASKGRAKSDSRMFPSLKEPVGKFGYSQEYPWQVMLSVNSSGLVSLLCCCFCCFCLLYWAQMIFFS